MKKSITFALYEDRWCSKCIRRLKCEQTKLDILLCSHNSFFKGPGDEDVIKNDPPIDNPVKICPHCGKEI